MAFLTKKVEHYDGLVIKADKGLHEQIAGCVSDCFPNLRNLKILDFGCGEGALAKRLSDQGHQLLAVDKDTENFKAKSIDFVCLNFDNPAEIDSFVDSHREVFDVVLGIEVIEHVHNQWKYIEQLHSMLKPGGRLIISTPNITSWLSRIIFLRSGMFHQFGEGDLEYGHISPITPFALGHIIKSVSGKPVEIRSAGTLPRLYLTGFNIFSIFSLLFFPVTFILRGYITGWCVLAIGQK